MKKVLFVLFAVTFVASMCFAEEALAPSGADKGVNLTQSSSNTTTPAQVPSTTVTPSPLSGNTTLLTPVATTTFTGKVNSVSSGNGISGTGPQITVKDDQGLETVFMIASDAAIIGKDGSTTTLNWISKDDKVAIGYITAQDGTKTAKSIKVSSDF